MALLPWSKGGEVMITNLIVRDLVDRLLGLTSLLKHLETGSEAGKVHSVTVAEELYSIAVELSDVLEEEASLLAGGFNQNDVESLTEILIKLKGRIGDRPESSGLFRLANNAIDSRNPHYITAAIAGIETILNDPNRKAVA